MALEANVIKLFGSGQEPTRGLTNKH